MVAGRIASQQPAVAVWGNHTVTVAKKDAVTAKVKDRIGAATDAVNAAAAVETATMENASATQESKTSVEQTCTNHTFGPWETVTGPTVNDCGLQRRTCVTCGHEEAEALPKLTAENNSVCVPSANMVIPFALTELNQTNVDAYGAVCDLNFFETYFGTNDIMVSGHQSNAIGNLYRTTVGDEITLNLNGNLTSYTVIISEEATVAAEENNYIGVDTATRFVTESYDRQALRMYTCYGEGRWIVVAVS